MILHVGNVKQTAKLDNINDREKTRERERGGEEIQRHRQTERERQRETDRHTDRQADREHKCPIDLRTLSKGSSNFSLHHTVKYNNNDGL